MNRLRIIRFSAFMGSRCRQIGLDAIEYAINTIPSSLGERAQSRLGNEVALAFFGLAPFPPYGRRLHIARHRLGIMPAPMPY